jgi:hypothetical protein
LWNISKSCLLIGVIPLDQKAADGLVVVFVLLACGIKRPRGKAVVTTAAMEQQAASKTPDTVPVACRSPSCGPRQEQTQPSWLRDAMPIISYDASLCTTVYSLISE